VYHEEYVKWMGEAKTKILDKIKSVLTKDEIAIARTIGWKDIGEK
jgi:hypothetical protein